MSGHNIKLVLSRTPINCPALNTNKLPKRIEFTETVNIQRAELSYVTVKQCTDMARQAKEPTVAKATHTYWADT